MSIAYEEIKEKVIAAYPSWNWELKVRAMKPRQIIAIYHNLQERKAKGKTISVEEPEEFRQVSLFDLYPDLMRR